MHPAENFSVGQLLAFKALNDNFLQLIITVISLVDELPALKQPLNASRCSHRLCKFAL